MDISLYISFDVFGSVGVLECVMSLLETLAPARDVGNHHRPAVAAQTVFEQASQF